MKTFPIHAYYSIGGKEKYENHYTTSQKREGIPLSSYNSKFLV